MIREWNKSDNESIAVLENLCFSYPWNKQMIDDMTAYSNFLGRVFEADGEVVGYAGVICGGDIADLALIAVKPENRRQGIAVCLIEEIASALKERGVVSLFLEVRAHNEQAKNLYAKTGFIQVGLRRNYYEDSEDAIVMVKEL